MAAARLADAWSAARRTFSGARAQAPRLGVGVSGVGANSEPHMTQAGAKAGSEPTMEDILASIRRIIAEDYAAQTAQQSAAQAPAVTQTSVARPQTPAGSSKPQVSQPVAASADPLDLAARADRFRPPMPEVVPVPPPVAISTPAMPTQATPIPRPLASPFAASSPPLTHGNAARAVSEFSERLGRSFAAAERYHRESQASEPQEQAVAEVEPIAAADHNPIASGTVEAVAAAVQSHLEAAIQAAHRIEPQRAPEPPKPVESVKEMPVSLRPEPVSLRPAPVSEKLRDVISGADAPVKHDPPPAWLVSPRTTTAVAGSFKALQDKAAPAQTATSPLNDLQAQALQELMTTALRPLLKDWLDQNLPSLVERMITAEIQRVTRGE